MTDAPERIWLTSFVKVQYGAKLGRGHISDLNHSPDYPEYIRADLAATDAQVMRNEKVKVLVESLAWYGEQARLCRIIHKEGDAGRHALDADGGKRARAALRDLNPGEPT